MIEDRPYRGVVIATEPLAREPGRTEGAFLAAPAPWYWTAPGKWSTEKENAHILADGMATMILSILTTVHPGIGFKAVFVGGKNGPDKEGERHA